MKKHSNVTIRMNASENSVTVDGVKFDRSTLSKGENKKLTRMVVAAKSKEYNHVGTTS